MKKVLLINPRFTEEVSIFNIPISLLYLGSYLIEKRYEVKILDALYFSKEEFRKRLDFNLLGWQPDLVGLTVMSTQIPHAIDISLTVKEKTKIPIVWGGVHPTLFPTQTYTSHYVDYVVEGDGEEAIIDILEEVEPKLKVKNRGPIDIDSTPGPNWVLLQQTFPDVPLGHMQFLMEFGIPILTSRGCPHKCTFCINSILGTKYRRRNLDLVMEDLEYAKSLGLGRVEFVDEDFFADKKRLFSFIDKVTPIGIEWVAGCRTSYFTDKYLGNIGNLKKIKKSGCWFLGTGAESGSQRILDKVNKGSKVEDTLAMAEALGKAGIQGNFSFMIGLPGETEEDYKATLDLIGKVVKTNPNTYVLGPQIYRPYPGSSLYNECVEQGMIEPQTLEEWERSPYIHFEFASKSSYLKEYYPWIQFKGDLTSLVFYATLMGVRPRFMPVTRVMRLIGKVRCKLYFFRFPFLKWLYGTIRGSGVENILRKRRVI